MGTPSSVFLALLATCEAHVVARAVARPAGTQIAIRAIASESDARPARGAHSEQAAFQDLAVANNQAFARARQVAHEAEAKEQDSREEWSSDTERPAPLPESFVPQERSSFAPQERSSEAAREAPPPAPFAPEATSVGVSGVLGMCSGKALRVASDAAALGLGAAFVFVSLLSRAGYVTINYTKVERDLLSVLDQNKGASPPRKPTRLTPHRPSDCVPIARRRPARPGRPRVRLEACDLPARRPRPQQHRGLRGGLCARVQHLTT